MRYKCCWNWMWTLYIELCNCKSL